ncbi:uncharacterized protein METZ01_LOCUS181442, partial [marine metagenome]
MVLSEQDRIQIRPVNLFPIYYFPLTLQAKTIQ